MRKLPVFNITIFMLLSFFFLFLHFTPVYSVTEEELENQIEETQQEIEEKESVLKNIEKMIAEISNSNYSVTQQINMINKEISKIEESIDEKDAEIERKLAEIEEKEKILEEKRGLLEGVSRQLYMESRVGSVEFFFSNTRIDEVIQAFFVKRSAISFLKDEITEITGEFEDLTVLKSELEEEKSNLDKQKKDLDDSYDLLLAEKTKLQRELNEKYNSRDLISRTINGLQSEISDLQYHLILVRQGGTKVDIDSVPSSGDYNATLAGFNEKAPAGSFAVFSIGAYTHRNGMSQWGARARADAGQTYTDILNHYYPGKSMRSNSVVINGSTENIMSAIPIDGYGTKSFEDYYLLGIKEVPESWPMEVLKAQAIAARTYAVRYTNNGSKSICTTQSCQVFSTPLKTGAWKEAVEATRGVILTNSDGSPALTQYAAVHGGWSNTSGWDTTDGTGDGSWMARAYDSISGVSWFYKSWYRQTYSESSSTCGRYPWLTQAEMADIVNAYQVWVANNRSDSRIVPIYDACHSSGNPYSHSELRNLASKPVSSISAAVASSGNGSTQTIAFSTNAGLITMSGNDFKTVYNMRAPGHLRIPQSGFVHINIEMK
jgi:SpoIID/LytB domain protein